MNAAREPHLRTASRDEVAMEVAYAWARRSTCLRRAVGCVLLDAGGRTLSTGHNGVAMGVPHCNEVVVEGADFVPWGKGLTRPTRMVDTFPNECPGARAPSGTAIGACQAVHAEQNAVAFCSDVSAIVSCYVTTSPCESCLKLLLNTGCRRIVFSEEYVDQTARDLWTKLGREWVHLPMIPGTPRRASEPDGPRV